jgi:uncharacterized protein YciI
MAHKEYKEAFEKRKKTLDPRPRLIPKHRKFLTPLHKKLKKLEDEYERLEKSYEERRKEHFLKGGPIPKRATIRMARILKQAAALTEKLGVLAPPVKPEKELEPGVLINPAHEKMIVSPEEYQKEIGNDKIQTT